MKIRRLPALAAVAALGIGASFLIPRATVSQTAEPEGDAIVAVTPLETLSDREQLGQQAFNAVCAECHGANAAGREGFGPPLIHRIYEPSHHGDMAFLMAVAQGVRAHHWPFGDMPPQPQVTRGDVVAIVTYVRALQRANGIE